MTRRIMSIGAARRAILHKFGDTSVAGRPAVGWVRDQITQTHLLPKKTIVIIIIKNMSWFYLRTVTLNIRDIEHIKSMCTP